MSAMSSAPPSPSTAVPLVRARPGRARRIIVVALVTLLSLAALSGCTRVQAGLAVQPDDTVNGDIVIATPDGAPDGEGPKLTVPPDLADDVDVTPYEEDGYIGSTVRFSGLTFDQVSRLSAVGGVAGGRADLQMRRVGGRIAVQGRADLTTVAVDGSDFQLKISFPGEVVETNGEADGGMVSWSFTPGEVGQINASVAATDPNAPSTLGWTLFLGLLVAVAAGAAVVLARRNRNPPVHS
ncbi:MAG: DUF3153 domain-containing protein [Pseudonocardia sp.]|nr:DUF3153 domain-containing protein [Pseudonocardia sp.]